MATIPNGAPDSLALIPEVSATTSAPIPLEHPKMNPGLSLVAPNNRADSERRWWQVSGSNTGRLPIATDRRHTALSAPPTRSQAIATCPERREKNSHLSESPRAQYHAQRNSTPRPRD